MTVSDHKDIAKLPLNIIPMCSMRSGPSNSRNEYVQLLRLQLSGPLRLPLPRPSSLHRAR